jgi:hypothetical protein
MGKAPATDVHHERPLNTRPSARVWSAAAELPLSHSGSVELPPSRRTTQAAARRRGCEKAAAPLPHSKLRRGPSGKRYGVANV